MKYQPDQNKMHTNFHMPTPHKICFVLALLVIVLVGCAERQPADIEADAERNFAKLKPLAREAETIEKQIVAEAAASAAKNAANLDAIRALRAKLAKLEGPPPLPSPAPSPAPSPTPGPSPVVPPPGPAPAPAPQPDPPSPKPALPPGEFGISQDVKTWAETLVPPEGRAAGVSHFIRAANAIATDCDSGKITGWNRIALVGAIKTAIGRENATIPPDVLISWRPFAAEFNKRANELFNAGKLTTPENWSTLLKEVVIGLQAAK